MRTEFHRRSIARTLKPTYRVCNETHRVSISGMKTSGFYCRWVRLLKYILLEKCKSF
jgi:hypothetical protein